MPDSDWEEAIRNWRALPEEERRRLHLAAIPRHVANSMAMRRRTGGRGLDSAAPCLPDCAQDIRVSPHEVEVARVLMTTLISIRHCA